MTAIRIEGAALQSAQTALNDAAKQFSSPATAGERSRNLTLSEVIGQLQGRRVSDKANPLAANVKDAPELTAPTQKAMLLAMAGPGHDESKGVQRASGNYVGGSSAARSGQARQLSEIGAQESDFDSSKLRGAAALRFWIAKIQETVDETTQTQLVDTLDRFQKQNKAQRDFHDKKSEEIQKKEVAAQKASQVMGCLGKIVGAAVVAVSVAAAVVTGGSSLVLAGVGLGLMAADAIAEKVTGESITGRLLSPLIERVFSPMAKAMGDGIASVLKKLNVSDDLAEMIGAIAGVVAAAVVVVAAAVVTKSAQIGKFAGKLAQPMMRSVGKVMPKLISSVGKKLSSTFGKAMSKADGLSKTLARNATRLTSKVGMGNAQLASLQASRAAIVAGGLNATSQAGFTGWMGINGNQIERAGAELTELFADMDSLKRVMDIGVNLWQQQTDRLQSLEKVASDAMQFEQNTNLFVLGNARRAAV